MINVAIQPNSAKLVTHALPTFKVFQNLSTLITITFSLSLSLSCTYKHHSEPQICVIHIEINASGNNGILNIFNKIPAPIIRAILYCSMCCIVVE
jgi:hypothetical protein